MDKVKHKHLLCLVSGLLLICCFTFSGIAEAAMGALTVQYKNIKIILNGQEVALGAQLVNINGSNYIPVKELAAAFNKKIFWDGTNQKINIIDKVDTSADDKANYRVQVGAFSEKENAEEMLQKLKASGFEGYIKFE